MNPEQRLTALAKGLELARREISPNYDDILHEVTAQIDEHGSLGKGDIAALAFWKRVRADTKWVPRLLGMTDSDVRHHTAKAVAAARNPDSDVIDAARQSRAPLRELPGFRTGSALASAVLVASRPDTFAVYDRNANTGLSIVGLDLPGNASDHYAQYMIRIEQCRAEGAVAGQHWSARDVDLALYKLGQANHADHR